MFTLLPTQLEQAERYISKDDLLLLAQGWFDVASPDGITTDEVIKRLLETIPTDADLYANDKVAANAG